MKKGIQCKSGTVSAAVRDVIDSFIMSLSVYDGKTKSLSLESEYLPPAYLTETSD